MPPRSARLYLLATLTAIACTYSAVSSSVSGSTAGSATPPIPIIEGGKSFGECRGYCIANVQVWSDGKAVFVLEDWPHDRKILNVGRLAPEAIASAQAISDGIAELDLQEHYVCQDCPLDMGTSYVKVWTPAGPMKSSYTYEHPPTLLATADVLLAELMKVMESCASSEEVELEPNCQPRPES